MYAGPHYYVISLSENTNVLFEAFRDTLIDIEIGGFPVEQKGRLLDPTDAGIQDEQRRDALKSVDEFFCGHYEEEPLKLVVVGESKLLTIFMAVTTHQEAIVGCVGGDFSATSPHDLGKIVWPIVKEEMSGLQARAMRDLETAEQKRRIAFGILSVGQSASAREGIKLLVEEDYHMRGSISEVGPSLTIFQDVDVMGVMDDVVDVVIEKVREFGGDVVFMPSGSLTRLERIALLLEG